GVLFMNINSFSVNRGLPGCQGKTRASGRSVEANHSISYWKRKDFRWLNQLGFPGSGQEL
ncbi:MAG: hypothetical protein KKA60_10260, partial [Proteobacteria bacterium]|nr:hypothetical protein [Pseudomonadota bacterium]